MKRSGRVAMTALLALVIIAVAAIGAGCGGDASEGGSNSRKVLYLVPTLDDEAYARQLAAAKQQAKKYAEIDWDFQAGTGRTGAEDQISKIEAAVTQGVDVIVVDSGDAGKQLMPALSRAIEQGTKVVVNSQPLPDLEGVTATIGFDHQEGAVPGGEYMAQQLKSGDKVAMIRCFVGTPATDQRAAGFEDGLEGSGIKIAATGDAKCDPAKARSITENFLTAHPDLDGILSETDIAVIGAVEALEAANKDLVVVGHDGQTASLKAIASGKVQDASVVYPYNLFGVEGVDTAAAVIEGEDVPSEITIPPQGLITKDNVQKYLDEAQAATQ